MGFILQSFGNPVSGANHLLKGSPSNNGSIGLWDLRSVYPDTNQLWIPSTWIEHSHFSQDISFWNYGL